MDILKHTNFFRAFTASSTIPSIYIEQFWDTIQYDKEALQITPVNSNQAFTSPPSFDALINFLNELGYPKLVRNLSNVVTNDMFQPWRALTTIINLCLTGKTFGFERPRAPVLQILWGVITQIYIDFAERIWEKFTQSIPTKSKHGFVSKKRTPISTLKSVDESVAEDIPAKEPQVDAEEADMQSALEESLKSMHDVLRGPLPPVVIKEPEPRKYQPLLEVSGKGKAKVTEEHVAHHLLNLQKPKKKSPTDQYIFQRRTSTPTGSSRHDESSFLYAELGLSDSEEESQEVVPGADARSQGEGQAGPDPGAQAEGQAGPYPGAQDEGHGGSNPDEQSEGQAGPNPGNAGADEQPIPSLVVDAGSDREHMYLDVADVSPQPSTEQMDEGFTATAYPKVQENLKLTVKEQVLLEEPASSLGTLSSLQHMSKYLSFGDIFFSDKPLEADNDKATTETEVESMVPESPKVHQQLKATTTETTTTTTTTTSLPPPYQQQQSTTDALMMKRISDLEHIMANLIQGNKKLEQRLDSHGARPYTLEQLDIPHQPPPPPPPPVGPSGASGSPGASGSSQVPPPQPPPLSINQESQSKGSAAPSSLKTAASAEYQAWTMTDIRLRPSIS
nr:hypothetical protein [Tanacetum cinerariifolium]GFA41970.1 hypothetical protein [Tanacetum cinerariifolium]